MSQYQEITSINDNTNFYFQVDFQKQEWIPRIILQFPVDAGTERTYDFYVMVSKDKFASDIKYIGSATHVSGALADNFTAENIATNYIRTTVLTTETANTHKITLDVADKSNDTKRWLCNSIRVVALDSCTEDKFRLAEIKPIVQCLANDFYGETIHLSQNITIASTDDDDNVVVLDKNGLKCYEYLSQIDNYYSKFTPTGLLTYNNGDLVAKVGKLDTNLWGAWFPRIYIGGASYDTAPFQTDSNGNVSINATSYTASASSTNYVMSIINAATNSSVSNYYSESKNGCSALLCKVLDTAGDSSPLTALECIFQSDDTLSHIQAITLSKIPAAGGTPAYYTYYGLDHISFGGGGGGGISLFTIYNNVTTYGNHTIKDICYFANGTTYKVDASGNATFLGGSFANDVTLTVGKSIIPSANTSFIGFGDPNAALSGNISLYGANFATASRRGTIIIQPKTSDGDAGSGQLIFAGYDSSQTIWGRFNKLGNLTLGLTDLALDDYKLVLKSYSTLDCAMALATSDATAYAYFNLFSQSTLIWQFGKLPAASNHDFYIYDGNLSGGARTIARINSNYGGWTLGSTSDLAGSTAQLYVNGHTKLVGTTYFPDNTNSYINGGRYAATTNPYFLIATDNGAAAEGCGIVLQVIDEADSATNAVYVNPKGNVNIGTGIVDSAGPTYKLWVSGKSTSYSAVDKATSLVWGGNLFLWDSTAQAAGVGGGLVLGGKYIDSNDGLAAGAAIQAYKVNSTSGNYAYGMNLITRAHGSDGAVAVNINESYGVTIGASNLAGTAIQLYVDSDTLNKQYGIYVKANAGDYMVGMHIYNITSGRGVECSVTTGIAIYGTATSGYGVYGYATEGKGIYGGATSGYAVHGVATTGVGTGGNATSGNGISGWTETGSGVFGTATGSGGRGGYFLAQGSATNALEANGYIRLYNWSNGAAAVNTAYVDTNGYLTAGSSSRRYKDNIVPLKYKTSDILAIEPVTFNWIREGFEDMGCIAEQVYEHIPGIVRKNEAGDIEAVKYEKLPVLLLAVVREQNARIEKLEQAISNLKAA